MNSDKNDNVQDPTPVFRIWNKEWGQYLDHPERWGGDDIKSHLEDHLLIGPTGRVFWLQHDGLKELTNEVEIHWQIQMK